MKDKDALAYLNETRQDKILKFVKIILGGSFIIGLIVLLAMMFDLLKK